MRKVGDIMKEMGFSKESSTSTQEAFIRHLIKAAYGLDVRSPSQDLKLIDTSELKKSAEKNLEHQGHNGEPTQLSFDFDDAS